MTHSPQLGDVQSPCFFHNTSYPCFRFIMLNGGGMNRLQRQFQFSVVLQLYILLYSIFVNTDSVAENGQKTEEMQLFTEMYHEWKGVENNHHTLKLPRLYDKVVFLIHILLHFKSSNYPHIKSLKTNFTNFLFPIKNHFCYCQ